LKTKTEAKRLAILDEAARAFRELGFERTSMAEISTRMGGSKATIYNYFASKEELFFEVMSVSTEDEFGAVHAALEHDCLEVEDALYRFGVRLLGFLYSQPLQAQRRLNVSEVGRSPQLGKLIYERGVLRSQSFVEAYFARAIARGALKDEQTRVMARHLYALLESEFQVRWLFLQLGEVTPQEIASATRRAVDVFLAGYRVDTYAHVGC
jgi:AcrR family transcriptional regulator